MVKGLKKRTIMNVTITSPFWKRRRDQIVESVIPYQWGVMNDEIDTTVPDDPAGNQLADNKSHAVANLKVAAGELDDEFHGMVFQDSDVYKWLEEAAYALAYHPDPELKALCDRTVDLIARAQQSDGYLDTPYQIKSGVWADRPRFSLIQQSHEMYVMGHYIEAAVAYHQVTGNEQALEVAKKMADCLDANFGPEEGKIHGADGHPEIELALAKLYEETGEKRYLTLSQYLIDVRGQGPQFYAKQLKAMNGDNIFHDLGFYKPTYFQAAEPVRDQQTADGHAVRVGYLCTGVAHVGRLLGDQGLIDTAKRFWKNIVTRRMYVTGAIGSTHVGESFTYDYDLPNDTMYGETCASVAMSMFAQQMLDLEPKGEYAEQEIFSLDELVKVFDIAGISKSPAIFDIEKLTYFNATYLRAMEPAAFAEVAEPYIRQAVKNPAIDAAGIAALLQARCEKLTDIPEKVDFFDALPDYDVEFFTNKKSKTNTEVSKAMLEAAIPALEAISDWTVDAIHDTLIDLAAKLEVKNATLMWPVRIAAAGKLVTPGGAVEICHLLGKDETLRRLRLGLDKLN